MKKGIGFTGLLQITFIVLKLAGIIEWSWWWVMAPAIATLALAVIGVIIIVLMLGKLE